MHSVGDVCASVVLVVTLIPIFQSMCRFPSTVTHHPTPTPPPISQAKPPANSRIAPLFSWLPPFSPFSITKLRNFPLFLLLPTLLKAPNALPSPAPYSPGSHPNVFPSTL